MCDGDGGGWSGCDGDIYDDDMCDGDGDGGVRSGCDGGLGVAGVMVMGDGGRDGSDGGLGVAGVMVGYGAHVLCG